MSLHRLTVLRISLAAACFIAANLHADTPKLSAPEKITSVEGITEYRLGNGMRVLLFPDQSKQTVTVNCTYFVGSRHEGYGETGMAHLLEHLLFKGTPSHPDIWRELRDKHGATFNGTTNYDRTNYFETMTATDVNLDFGLSLEADRMVNSFIAKKDLDSEFSVVRNEFEMGENSPERVLEERIWSTAYLWHNYGKSTIGSREDIERVPIERLQAFYRKYYQPDNAMLVVAGKFDVEKTLQKINEKYGSIPRPSRVLEKTYTVEPTQDGEREVILRRVGDVQAFGAAYHICAGSHPDMVALEVLADVLQADQTGHLYKALVETHMATRVTARAEDLFDPGLITFSAEIPADKSLDAVRKTLIEIVEGIAAKDISEEEVTRSKNAFAKRFDNVMSDSGRVAVMLSNWAAQGDWRLLFLHRDRMKAVTPADVKRVAAQYLKSSNRTVGSFIPTKQPERTRVPETPDVLLVLKDYKGQAAVAQGEDFEPTPANVESRTQRGALACGVKTAMLPKKTRGGRVFVELVLHYGSEETLKGRTEAASMMANLIERGTAKHTRRQLEDALDKLGANVSIGAGGGGMGGRAGRMLGGGGATPGTLTVSIETLGKNLTEVVALVGEMLREPAFPQAEFDKLQKQSLTRLEASRTEPQALAMNALQRKTSPYEPSDIPYVPTIDERIERTRKVKLEDIKRVYADLVGASAGELAAVGEFEPKALTAAFDKILADWKSPKPFERIARPYHAVTPDEQIIDTPDKAMAVVLMGTTMELRDDDADAPAMTIGNAILGTGGGSRLITRLRQKEGYSYSVSSMMMPQSQDRSASQLVFAICAPENAGKAMTAACEEITRFLKDGIQQNELDDAKSSYDSQLKMQLSSEGALANMLARQTYLGRTMKFASDQAATVQSLTVEQVNAVVRKHLSADKFVKIRAGDEKNKKTAQAGEQN